MSSYDVVILLVGIIGSSALTTLIASIATRKKTHADADSVTIKNALALQEATVERLNSYDKQFEVVKHDLHDFERYINYLDSLLWRAGIAHMTLEQYRQEGASPDNCIKS